MLKNIKAAIFDMDGTLIDSMWIWRTIGVNYLKKRNIKMPSLKDKIGHLNFKQTAEYFKTTFNLPDSPEEIMQEWNDMAYEEYANNIKLKPGASEFLFFLKTRGIKIGLATSNCKELLDLGLKSTGIYDYFDSITTIDEVSRGKEFPDIYLLAAEKLNVAPQNCMVFEDILPAMLSAKSAGMKVVGVHDLYCEYPEQDIKEHTDIYIVGYDELTNAV